MKSSEIPVLESVIDDKEENTQLPYKSKITELQRVSMEYSSEPDSSEEELIKVIDEEDVMIVNVPSDGDCAFFTL